MKIHVITSWQLTATILLLAQEDVEMLVAEQKPGKPGLLAALTPPKSLSTTW